MCTPLEHISPYCSGYQGHLIQPNLPRIILGHCFKIAKGRSSPTLMCNSITGTPSVTLTIQRLL
jgi:hypothetical protein